jgi:hypothetical protein
MFSEPASFLANTYSGIFPVSNLAKVTCRYAEPCTASPDGLLFGGIFMGFFLFSLLVIAALIIVSTWKIFQKAGQPGWASIVPVYNYIIMLRIVRRPWWFIFLLFIPLVTVVINVLLHYDLAKAFGKRVGYMFGLLFLPFIFFPMLAFGEATYKTPIRHS